MAQYNFGSGILVGTPLTSASGAAISNPSPIQFGALQDVSVDFSFDNKELYGQNQFALTVGRGKGKISGKAKMAQISALLFNSLFFGQSLASGVYTDFIDTIGTAIPAGTFTIAPVTQYSSYLNGTVPVFGYDLGVKDSFGVPMTRVASAPTTGQYSTTAGSAASGGSASFANAGTAASGASCSFSGTVMTLNTIFSAGTFAVGQAVSGPGIPQGTVVIALASGSLNVATSTYTLNQNVGTIANTSGITSANASIMTMTVSTSAGQMAVGQTVVATGVPTGTTIQALLTGSMGASGSTYSLSGQTGTIGAESFTTGTGYLFAAADVGKTVFTSFNYTATPSTGMLAQQNSMVTNVLMGQAPTFQADFYTTFAGDSLSLTLFQCVANKLTIGTKLDDFLIPEFDFMAYANGAGQVVKWQTSHY